MGLKNTRSIQDGGQEISLAKLTVLAAFHRSRLVSLWKAEVTVDPEPVLGTLGTSQAHTVHCGIP
ncbi:hypothetical protein PGIGA_G00058940 [Pangasianodon gigas]|uniref:Uncharacterized protein n=1 Tax=Pangasianodon gigas TaxID=30993 RepID=A0ACC5X4S6_PANGG|nr:hypothetical protein [Pangasianodon gigas]